MQGPTILWHKGPFSLSLLFALCFTYGLSFFIFSWNPVLQPLPSHLSPEENLNRPPSPQSFTRIFSLPPSHDEGWTQQLTFQFVFRSDPQCSSPDRHAELLITSVLTLAIFGFDFQVQISIFFKSFIWKNEVLPLRKEELQDCAYSSFTTRSHTKKEKKSLYQLEWTYFSKHLCFHILCVSI